MWATSGLYEDGGGGLLNKGGRLCVLVFMVFSSFSGVIVELLLYWTVRFIRWNIHDNIIDCIIIDYLSINNEFARSATPEHQAWPTFPRGVAQPAATHAHPRQTHSYLYLIGSHLHHGCGLLCQACQAACGY